MLSLAVWFALTSQFATAECIPSGGNCGPSRAASRCCATGSYFMPWDADYFLRIPTPARCARQFTNVDFYTGNENLMTIYGLGPSDCCKLCPTTDGCRAYTFVNDNSIRTACYLKVDAGRWRYAVGAVSALVDTTDDQTQHFEQLVAQVPSKCMTEIVACIEEQTM